MSGYFLAASKPGGLTIQPWTRAPPLDPYQISSTDASRLLPMMSSFTSVKRVRAGAGVFFTSIRTTSAGCCGSLRTPTATSVRDNEFSETTCAPCVTSRTPPDTSA